MVPCTGVKFQTLPGRDPGSAGLGRVRFREYARPARSPRLHENANPRYRSGDGVEYVPGSNGEA